MIRKLFLLALLLLPFSSLKAQEPISIQAGGDDPLVQFHLEKVAINKAKNRCYAGVVACLGASTLVAAVGGPWGLGGGALMIMGCMSAMVPCKTEAENEIFIIDHAIEFYNKCPAHDSACRQRAIELRNIKPQPLPTP